MKVEEQFGLQVKVISKGQVKLGCDGCSHLNCDGCKPLVYGEQYDFHRCEDVFGEYFRVYLDGGNIVVSNFSVFDIMGEESVNEG